MASSVPDEIPVLGERFHQPPGEAGQTKRLGGLTTGRRVLLAGARDPISGGLAYPSVGVHREWLPTDSRATLSVATSTVSFRGFTRSVRDTPPRLVLCQTAPSSNRRDG
jgi:hypothetical protein